MNIITKEQAEQNRCKNELERFGHNHKISHEIRLGASDWLMEEILIMYGVLSSHSLSKTSDT